MLSHLKNFKFLCALIIFASSGSALAEEYYSCTISDGSNGSGGQDLFSKISGFEVVYDSSAAANNIPPGSKAEQLDNKIREESGGTAYLVIDPTIADDNKLGKTEVIGNGEISRIVIADIDEIGVNSTAEHELGHVAAKNGPTDFYTNTNDDSTRINQNMRNVDETDAYTRELASIGGEAVNDPTHVADYVARQEVVVNRIAIYSSGDLEKMHVILDNLSPENYATLANNGTVTLGDGTQIGVGISGGGSAIGAIDASGKTLAYFSFNNTNTDTIADAAADLYGRLTNAANRLNDMVPGSALYNSLVTQNQAAFDAATRILNTPSLSSFLSQNPDLLMPHGAATATCQEACAFANAVSNAYTSAPAAGQARAAATVTAQIISNANSAIIAATPPPPPPPPPSGCSYQDPNRGLMSVANGQTVRLTNGYANNKGACTWANRTCSGKTLSGNIGYNTSICGGD